jgi:hypothetical protein
MFLYLLKTPKLPRAHDLRPDRVQFNLGLQAIKWRNRNKDEYRENEIPKPNSPDLLSTTRTIGV